MSAPDSPSPLKREIPRGRRRVFTLILLGSNLLILTVAIIVLFRFLVPRNKVLARGQNPVLLTQLGRQALDPGIKLLRMRLMPYTGYHHPANLSEENLFQGKPYKFKTNNYGFLTPYDLDPFSPAPRKKSPDERVVLVTGGSAALGLGASSVEATFASLLEGLLASADALHKWKVVNLSMGSWIAYQEFIALDLYGSPLSPDFIVAFDGRNDILVPTIAGERVPNHYYFTGQRRLNDMFEEPPSPPFLRLRQISRQLEAVSKTPAPVYSEEEVAKAAAFYVRALESIALRFRECRILFVTQPTQLLFADEKDEVARVLKSGYAKFLPQVAALPAKYGHTRHHDASRMFPEPVAPYFVDECHLSDAGHKIAASLIAKLILSDSP